MARARDDTTAAKRRLRARGWYVRYTEWPSGHQVVLHLRSDTAVHLVTRWWPTETEAFEEALAMAAEHELRAGRPPPVPGPPQGPPRGDPARASAERPRDLDVVILGDAREELVMRTPRLPAAGETVESDELLQGPGGKGARQAIAAARLGARVALVARVGADEYGDEIVARLRAEGVGTERIVRDPDERTRVALVHLDRRARRSGAVLAEGANARLSLEDVRAAEAVIGRASAIVASLEVPPQPIAEAFRIARRHGTQAILDAAPSRRVSDRLFALADVAIVGAHEAGRLTGSSVTGRRSALSAARSLLRRGAGAIALRASQVTLLLTRSDEIWIPAGSGADPDTPEAADVFSSTLAVALGEGRDLARAGQLASAAAAIARSRSRSGESAALPTRAEVTSFADESPRAEELVLDGVLPADAPPRTPGHLPR